LGRLSPNLAKPQNVSSKLMPNIPHKPTFVLKTKRKMTLKEEIHGFMDSEEISMVDMLQGNLHRISQIIEKYKFPIKVEVTVDYDKYNGVLDEKGKARLKILNQTFDRDNLFLQRP
jgi:hypothetical protein